MELSFQWLIHRCLMFPFFAPCYSYGLMYEDQICFCTSDIDQITAIGIASPCPSPLTSGEWNCSGSGSYPFVRVLASDWIPPFTTGSRRYVCYHFLSASKPSGFTALGLAPSSLCILCSSITASNLPLCIYACLSTSLLLSTSLPISHSLLPSLPLSHLPYLYHSVLPCLRPPASPSLDLSLIPHFITVLEVDVVAGSNDLVIQSTAERIVQDLLMQVQTSQPSTVSVAKPDNINFPARSQYSQTLVGFEAVEVVLRTMRYSIATFIH